jgi:hypothetical protein
MLLDLPFSHIRQSDGKELWIYIPKGDKKNH